VALTPAVVVAVEDQFGNVVTSDSSTVTLTLSSGTFANGSTTATARSVNGIAMFGNLVINKTGSYALAASDGTLIGATSGNVAIIPAAASKLVYQQAPPATGTAGAALSPAVRVAVEDAFGNVVTSDTSTVTLTLSSGTFSTGTSTAIAVASSGVATFSSLTINTAGTYTLAASDGTLTATVSGNITIIPAVASKLAYQQAPPATGTAGVALSPAVIVAIVDRFGNVVTSDSSAVTLTLSTGTFSNGSTTASATAINGVATFGSLVLNKTASYKLTASDGTLTKITSGNFVISAAAASQLVFQQAPPATGTAGAALSPAVKVVVEDQFGNVVASDTSTVTLTLSNGTFSNGSITATAVASSGIATFNNLIINTAGTYSLTASDGSLSGPASGNIVINAAAASKLVFLQAPPATGIAGAALSSAVTVAVEDQFGNVVVVNGSTVTLTLSSGTFSNGSKTTTATAVNGVATFGSIVINKAGSYTLAASDGTLTKVTSTSFVINPAAASQLVFLQVPAKGNVGVALATIQVAVEDQFGNIVTSDNSTITLRVASGPGGFTATSTTTVQVVNGIATFSNSRLLLRQLLTVEVAHDAGNVLARLQIWRNALVLLHAVRSGVVGRKRFDKVEVVTLQQLAQITGAAVHIRFRIEGVRHPQLRRGSRHELHQSLRAFGRNGMNFEPTLRSNDAADQIWIEPVTIADNVHHLGNIHMLRHRSCPA
jgi:hypothetical protein